MARILSLACLLGLVAIGGCGAPSVPSSHYSAPIHESKPTSNVQPTTVAKQAPSASPDPIISEKKISEKRSGFVMIRKDGSKYLLKSYRQEGKYYKTVDANEKETQHLKESVESIEPVSESEYSEALASYQTPGGSREKTKPKTPKPSEVASSTQNVPQPSATDSFPDSMRGSSSSKLGTTPQGFQLHQGPKGGIYHYSKNGKKVYEKK